MSFSEKLQKLSAAKAERMKPIPAAMYAAVVTSITWPDASDDPLTYITKDTKQEVEYVRPTIKCKLLEPYGEHDLEPEEYKQLPREFAFDVMITEDNPDAGLLVFQNLIYDALQLGDIEADAANDIAVVDKLPDCLNREVIVETKLRKWKTKDGEEVESVELKRFHPA